MALDQLFTPEEMEKMNLSEDGSTVTAQEEKLTDDKLLEVKKLEIASLEDFKIEGQEGFVVAGKLLARTKDSIKEVKKRLEAALQPLKDRKAEIDQDIKKAKEPYEVVLSGLDAMEKRMSQLVLDYNAKLEAERLKLQAIEDKKFEKNLAKSEKEAEKQGTTVQIPQHKQITRTSAHQAFGVQIKTYQTFTIPKVIIQGAVLPNASLKRTNPALREIPDQYWVLDTKGLAQAHKAKGCEIPGTIHATKSGTAR